MNPQDTDLWVVTSQLLKLRATTPKNVTKTWQQWKVSEHIKPKTYPKSKRRWSWVLLGALAVTPSKKYWSQVLLGALTATPNNCSLGSTQSRHPLPCVTIPHDTNKCLSSDLHLLNNFKTSVLLYTQRSLLLRKHNNLIMKNKGLMFSYRRSSATKSEISTSWVALCENADFKGEIAVWVAYACFIKNINKCLKGRDLIKTFCILVWNFYTINKNTL